MKNAIIIDGNTYELVPNDTDDDICDTCDLQFMCSDVDDALCVMIHDAELNERYIEQPKQEGGET